MHLRETGHDVCQRKEVCVFKKERERDRERRKTIKQRFYFFCRGLKIPDRTPHEDCMSLTAATLAPAALGEVSFSSCSSLAFSGDAHPMYSEGYGRFSPRHSKVPCVCWPFMLKGRQEFV